MSQTAAIWRRSIRQWLPALCSQSETQRGRALAAVSGLVYIKKIYIIQIDGVSISSVHDRSGSGSYQPPETAAL
jgi:hypothetical protein